MHWHRIGENWAQFKPIVRGEWREISNEDFEQIGGDREQLIERIRRRYNVVHKEAERQVKEWESDLR